MKSLHALRLLPLAGLLPLLALPVQAQEPGRFYTGASIGSSRAKLDEAGLAASRLNTGVSLTGLSSDERDTGYKLFGGYQFSPYLAVEAGLFSLGSFSFNGTTAPTGTLDGNFKYRGLNLDLVGRMPISENLSALLRVGAQRSWSRNSFGGSGMAVPISDPTPRTRGLNYKLGAGLQYQVGPQLSLRAELERYRINDALDRKANVNSVSIGLLIPFGSAPRAAPRATAPPAAPPPVMSAATPEPAPLPAPAPAALPPIIVAVPSAPAPRRISFSAEALFSFDQAGIRPEGRPALDEFAREAQASSYERIDVQGHTDRLGSSAYNQTLSLQRAEAVKAYLVSSAGISASKISASGKGEQQPITDAADCKGPKSTALIACLQPDRRVEIEVQGTR